VNKTIENYFINSFNGEDYLYDHLLKLFSIYSSMYVKNFEEFQNSPNTFFKFLMENIDLIKKHYKTLEEKDIIRCFERIKELLGYQIFKRYKHDEQSTFSNIVSNIANNNKNKHVLDVGAGSVPYSSILLGQSIDTVSSMDRYFWLGDECLKNLNVNPISQYFNRETNIDDYDMVVGRFPCSAIDSIVYLCKKYNKKYFIETCDCEMPSPDYFYKKWGIVRNNKNKTQSVNCVQSQSGKFCTLVTIKEPAREWFGWSTMLPDIDKDIKSYNSYIYNVGESSGDIERLIKKYKKTIEYEDVISPQQTKIFSMSKVINKSISNWFVANDEMIE